MGRVALAPAQKRSAMASRRRGNRGSYRNSFFTDETFVKTLEAVEPVDESQPSKSRCGSFVYFLHAPELRRVKIGWSRDPGRRAQRLRCVNRELAPFKTQLLATIDGGHIVERCLHRRFSDHHVSGEWFDDVILPQLREIARADAEWFGSDLS